MLKTMMNSAYTGRIPTFQRHAEEKENALRFAAEHGRIDDVKTLIESGVNPNAPHPVCY